MNLCQKAKTCKEAGHHTACKLESSRGCKDYKHATAPKDAAKDNKLPVHLNPQDLINKYLTPAYQEGVIKYEEGSWRRGFPISELMDAVDRHKEKFFYQCEDLDQEALDKFGIEKTHLAAIIFSCFAALHTLEYYPELDDRRDPKTGEIES